ncbi:MAG: chemotaxis regulatory protein CheY [Methanomassiliicoccales archaeon PtaU1.Bin124]|nr:MAG: chemotaxis regulatory protein CheY [Methanomassiliicoccales archaeon PtaU1.Bin124]
MREALSRSSFKVSSDSVGSGEEALNYLEARGPANIPDLILMDLSLPFMDGFELLSKIRERPNLRYVPVIVFSGSDRPDDIQRAYQSGASGYVTKPIGLKKLEDSVRVIQEYWFGVAKVPTQKFTVR